MPIALPDLDDRRFADLVDEARALIPALAPDWTNHNPSDPGITLVELFAYLAEMLMYRLNRITPANKIAFLQLLNGPPSVWTPPAVGDPEAIDAEVRRTVLALRSPQRAVSAADFESLALQAKVDPPIVRARCVWRRNLASASPDADAPGHLSLVVVPRGAGAPAAQLLADVGAALDPVRPLTTRLHVVAPVLLPVVVTMTLYLDEDADASATQVAAVAALVGFFDPLTGGENGAGWAFGRPVYVSEVYRVLDGVKGVDYVDRTGTTDEVAVADATRRVIGADGRLVSLTLKPHELVDPRSTGWVIVAVRQEAVA